MRKRYLNSVVLKFKNRRESQLEKKKWFTALAKIQPDSCTPNYHLTYEPHLSPLDGLQSLMKKIHHAFCVLETKYKIFINRPTLPSDEFVKK